MGILDHKCMVLKGETCWIVRCLNPDCEYRDLWAGWSMALLSALAHKLVGLGMY